MRLVFGPGAAVPGSTVVVPIACSSGAKALFLFRLYAALKGRSSTVRLKPRLEFDFLRRE